MIFKSMFRSFSTLSILIAAMTAASAHHPTGGSVPATAMHGLLSGIGHPIIGLDHAVFILAAGALAALAKRGFSIVAAFIASSLLGTILLWNGFSLTSAEMIVAFSLMSSGFLLFRKEWISLSLIVPLFIIAGLAHGMALGEAVIGAEATPIGFYLLGVCCAVLMVAALAYRATGWLVDRDNSLSRYAMPAFASLLLIMGGVGLI
jgi:urease accessory protein